MASKTFKVNVDLDSKSLSKLKKTLSDARVKVDEKSIASLENAMSELEAELDRNSEHLNVLTNAIESMGSGKGGGGLGDMGGAKSAAAGGATGILSEIRDLLESNGARLKSLADTNESGFNEAAHTRLKQLSRSQLILDDQLKTKRIWMRGMMGGGKNPIGSALMGMGSAIFGKLADASSDVFKYQTAQDQGKMDTKSPTFNSQSEETKKEQAGGLIGSFEKTQKRAEGKFGKALGKLGGGKGMKIAGGIGMGAMAGGAIVKKGMQALIESSPMLKQMMKMLNFGGMMILRPLGDFFGFFLRPIFIMLLRKFIIPFYQTYLPMMQQMGHDMGERVVKLLMLILDWFTDPAELNNVTGTGALVTEETQQAQLAAQKAALAAGVTDQDALVKLLQQVEKDVDPDNAKFQTEISKAGQHTTHLQDTVDTTAGYDPSGLTTGIAVMTPEHQQMFDELGVSIGGVTEAADEAMDGLESIVYGSNGVAMDAEPIMSATDLIREKAQYDKTTGSQSGRYNTQNVNITVEGNLDTEAAKQMEEKMKTIAQEESENVYKKGNPRY